MELKFIGEKPESKYNYNNKVVDLNTIPLEDLDIALKDFSEGSPGLEECLKTLWKTGLKTKACCKGDHVFNDVDSGSLLGEAYIAFESGIDFFSYLSSEIISNENVALSYEKFQTITIYGQDKEKILSQIARDVLTGKKKNQELIKAKLNKDVSNKTKIDSFIYRLYINGFNEEEINELIPIVNAIINFKYDENNLQKSIDENNHLIESYKNILMNFINEHNQKIGFKR